MSTQRAFLVINLLLTLLLWCLALLLWCIAGVHVSTQSLHTKGVSSCCSPFWVLPINVSECSASVRRSMTLFQVILLILPINFSDMKIKVSCLGDEFKLECPFMSVLLVHLTSPSIPPSNSSLCADGSKFPVPCDLLSYSDWLKKECSGRRACTTGKVSPSELRRNCRMSYIVTVVYECSKCFIYTLASLQHLIYPCNCCHCYSRGRS